MTHTRSEIGKAKRQTPARADEIVRVDGPFAGADRIHSVTHDGRRVWAATDIRRVDPESGAVLERLETPRGTAVSGMESDGANFFYCGGGSSGTVRAVRKPKSWPHRERSSRCVPCASP